MKPFTANARDAGLALIGRVNRLMLGGAVALTGGLSVAAAKSFHGHQRRAAAVSAPSTSSGGAASSAASSSGSGSDSSGGLQAPAQMPAPVQQAPAQQTPAQQVPAPVQQAPVVSGGS